VELSESVPLAAKTTLGVGGPARELVVAKTERTVEQAVLHANRFKINLHVLGGGSNVVVSDAGVAGLVLAIELRGVRFDTVDDDAELVTAQAGEPWDPFVESMIGRGLGGLECLSGIPGLVGATPIQNVGAYGQEVSESIVRVRALDRASGRTVELSREDCRFGYRDSLFKSREPNRYIVLDVTFRLERNRPPNLKYPDLVRELEVRGATEPTLLDVRNAVIAIRRSKSMVIEPGDENARSCGSFFVNPIVDDDLAKSVAERAGETMPSWPAGAGRKKLSAAWLIEHAGLGKGTRRGQVGISTKHSLALVCHGSARADEVVAFAREIRRTVESRFGVLLVPEPVFWGFQSLDDGLPDERLA
jgi:UDP-N-acetylmuramate dehydrogenase